MAEKRTAGKMRRAILAASILAIGILGVGTAAWLAGSNASTWRELYSWYNPAVGFRSAALPVGFEDLVDRIKPTVVGVRAKVEQDADEEERPSGRGAPSNRSDVPMGDRGTSQPRIATTLGSGFFISSDGYAMTTSHLVRRSEKIEITTDDGKIYPAKLVGADPKTDLALLKIEGEQEFPVAQIADKAPRIGARVLAVGNPFGLGGTVTAGIVSARARDIIGPYNDFIQIDAPVNQGSSGGPTFDVSGKVIGINSAIFSPTGGSVGVGFAIPAETVKTIAERLKQNGTVSRGWIGVEVQSVSPDLVEGLGLNKPVHGVLVAEIQPDSPAAKADIAPGDVITSVAGQPAGNDRDLIKRVSDMPPGKSIELRLVRQNEQKNINITLGELPVPESRSIAEKSESPTPDGNKPNVGLTLMPADNIGLGVRGVVVTDLDPGGVAAESGLSTGDVILDVGGNAVMTPADFYKALTEVQSKGKRIALARVKANQATRFVAIPVS
ncbi:PDZ domain-containing protein [Bradyrhizobium sp. CSA112]|uniref:trypsin-like peptidase domain-containing protein n=1 Tax=Bradyrhizobium sp. CSA112 TaxID=2699170 RepID=UPI0023AF2518|nr:trypsin-like peptidase domain-containing protein [Bradyrhizobium sp. CSA112]MDE5455813.1 PDZ domain-containing protein [Bradyrhizobium sp. CSA112]